MEEEPREETVEETPKDPNKFGEDNLKEPELPEITKPQYRQDEYMAMATHMLQLPNEIEAYELKFLACTKKEDYINKRSQEIKDRIYVNVITERIEGNLRYPDANSINKEAMKRLQESKLWTSKQAGYYSKISVETDGGKRRYSNEKARQAEVTKRIFGDKEIKELNVTVTQRVSVEKEEGKSSYANEKQREIELQRRLNGHTEYQLLMKEQKGNVDTTQKTKTTIYRLRHQMEAIKIVTEIMKIMYRTN